MADQNQDLPLVVSEILIEMHELRADVQGLQQEMRDVKSELREVKNTLFQVVGAINSLTGSMKTMIEENRQNTEMLIEAFRGEGLRIRSRLDDHDGRISALENK